MRKFLSCFIAVTMLSTLLVGCNSGDQKSDMSSTNEEQAASAGYEYEFRELPEAIYIEAATEFAAGTGTESDPYQISNAAELAFMGEVLSDQDKPLDNEYDDAYYVLTADISLNDVADFENWTSSAPEFSWKPIDASSFRGVFDGAGHTISGMYINTNCGDANNYERGNYGIFGEMAGTVKNLTVDKSYIAVSGSTAVVGGIVGNLYDVGKIENCVSKVSIDCYDATCGGVVGSIVYGFPTEQEDEEVSYSEIIDCSFEGVINQKKEGSLSFIGGIAGTGGGNISKCVNNGIINFGADDVDCAGGIIAFWREGIISECENKGELNGEISEAEGLARVGGIVGNMFLSGTGSEKYMSRGATVTKCKNSGIVSGHYTAGGIVGNASNDHNDWCLTISDCSNDGNVQSAGYTGGVVGRLICIGDADHGSNVVVENCINTAELAKGTVGGIIGYFESENGDAVIRGCENKGNITTDSQNCAGIIAYWLMDSKPDVTVTIADCKNDGTIHSPLNAGGIFGYADVPVILEDVKNSSISVKNCTNNGEIITYSDNCYIGGIAGNWGMKTVPTTFESCTNSGTLSILNEMPDSGTINSLKIMSLSRIAGGIIGRLGEGLLLTTDSDEVDSSTIQQENAVVVLKNCSNTGTLNVNESEEFKNSAGEQIYVNYFGGIIGNACGEEGFSVYVDNCNFSNFDRGLGNVEFEDVGDKITHK